MPKGKQQSATSAVAAQVFTKPLQDEAADSFLEYAQSVIQSRALPDVRDGLKPVHRRILFAMHSSGLRPDHAHVKSARIVGDVMGKYHPHGDSAIYEALARLAQDFSMNTPLIDGHGNFGSPNDPPAAMRYTEARLTEAALALVRELGEDTVPMVENYDGSLIEPDVLPAELPFLLINGTTGIAVGMATKMPPHNFHEVVTLTRAYLENPNLTTEEATRIVPAPDFPTGGQILGADGIREAFETGKGSFRIRGEANIQEQSGRQRATITFTSLPYEIGTEKIIESIKAEISKKRLDGISDVRDLTDRKNGISLVVECKPGFNPRKILADLYRYTPAETGYSVSNLAIVDGKPTTLGTLDIVRTFLDFRRQTVTRRTQFRLDKAENRLHIVAGLLVALAKIEEVVRVIKASKTTQEARDNLQKRFKLSEIQATHILDMPLRRLVNLEVKALEEEEKQLNKIIKELKTILASKKKLDQVIDGELHAILEKIPSPERKTRIIDESQHLEEQVNLSSESQLIFGDSEPTDVTVMLSIENRVAARITTNSEQVPAKAKKADVKSVLAARFAASVPGNVLAITTAGNAHRVPIDQIITPDSTSMRGTPSLDDFVDLEPGEKVVSLIPEDPTHLNIENSPGVFLSTRNGVVKISQPEFPNRRNTFELISLKPGDTVIAAQWVKPDSEIALVSSAAQLLIFPTDSVRPQGRSGSGVAGIKLGVGETVITAALTEPGHTLITHTGKSIKVTPVDQYPRKGRATGGVRAHRFLKEEDQLTLVWIGNPNAHPVTVTSQGEVEPPPEPNPKRDGSGSPCAPLRAIGLSY